jgi:hypothetical protein
MSYIQSEPGKPSDVRILSMTGSGRPFAFAEPPAAEYASAFSPDGRFPAYVSEESGRPEVFVRGFAASRARWQVSTKGGVSPAWRSDGRELVYLSLDGRLIAVPTTLAVGGLEPGTERPLFKLPETRKPTPWRSSPYTSLADGQRFLVNVLLGEEKHQPIALHTGGAR